MNAIGYINQSEYEPRFWNMARCRSGQDERLSTGYNTANGTYALPAAFGKKLGQALSQESLFRGMATVIRAYGNDYTLYAKDTDDLAQFVEEGGLIPVYDGIEDFTISKIGSHKLAVFAKLDEDFVNDAGFSMTAVSRIKITNRQSIIVSTVGPVMASYAYFDTKCKIKRHLEIGCIFHLGGCKMRKVKREGIALIKM